MKVIPSKLIWFNGELIPWEQARIHVLSHVVHYGTGVFEGIRAYAGRERTAVLGLRQHVHRLFTSCNIMDLSLEYTEQQVSEAILETIAANGQSSCYIRPLVFRGYGEIGVDPTESPIEFVIATFPFDPLLGADSVELGVDVGVSSWRRIAPDTHPAMAKAVGNYVNSMLIVTEAKRNGFAEGIALDSQGYVSEGSGENIFLVRDGTLLTPPAGNSILEGITRGFVMQLAKDQGMPVEQRQIPREMLYIAEEMFFTGTAAEITPIRRVDGRQVGAGGRGPLTERLQRDFFSILSGESEDRHEWLTPVRSS